jgi:hypothetical protein
MMSRAKTLLLRGTRGLFAARWVCTIAAALCLSLWIFNLWAWPQFGCDWCVLRARHGAIEFSMHDPDDPLTPEDRQSACQWLSDLPGYDFGSRIAFFRWRPWFGSVPSLSGNHRLWYADLPLWIPLAAFGAIGFNAWRRFTRRAKAACACTHCGYDLAGLPTNSPCPECGR